MASLEYKCTYNDVYMHICEQIFQLNYSDSTDLAGLR